MKIFTYIRLARKHQLHAINAFFSGSSNYKKKHAKEMQ